MVDDVVGLGVVGLFVVVGGFIDDVGFFEVVSGVVVEVVGGVVVEVVGGVDLEVVGGVELEVVGCVVDVGFIPLHRKQTYTHHTYPTIQ